MPASSRTELGPCLAEDSRAASLASPLPERERRAAPAPAPAPASPGRPAELVDRPRLALADLEGALRLAAHDHHEVGILARLATRALIGDDEGRAGEHHLR